MSTFRKTVLTTAIVGAGLAATTGSAFATEHHDGGHDKGSHSKSSKGCGNASEGAIDNTGSSSLVGVLDGSQGSVGTNVCDILSGNSIGSDNKVAVLGSIF